MSKPSRTHRRPKSRRPRKRKRARHIENPKSEPQAQQVTPAVNVDIPAASPPQQPRPWYRKRIKTLALNAGLGAIGAAITFVAGALFVALISDWVEQSLVPRALKTFGYEQTLYLYRDLNNPDAPADMYDFLVPSSGSASGRMIQTPEAAKSDRGEKEPPRNFKVKGTRTGDLLSFTYASSSDLTGIGAFIGQRSDTYENIYVGKLMGWGKEERKTPDVPDRCTIVSLWAAIGPPSEAKNLGNALKRYVESDASKKAVPPLPASTSSVAVKCNAPPTPAEKKP